MMSTQQTPLEQLQENSDRVREIIGVAVHYGLSDWFESIPFPGAQEILHRIADSEIVKLPIEVRIRMALTDLGPTFIKVGQVLSTRVDLIGSELADELSSLQDDTPADPPEVVSAIIAREFGQPISQLFAKFEAKAYASASIAQVHRAILFTDEVVAVKVQKEGIQGKIESDLSIMEALAQLAEERSEAMKDYGVCRIVKEFRRSIFNELDFRREQRNIETFKVNFADDETVHFPQTWPDLCSTRVLTMEFMEGVLGSEVSELPLKRETLDIFARKSADVYLKMIFRDGFYHADPHPGNIMLLNDGTVGILDCGMVERIDEGLRADLETLIGAITAGNADDLTDTLWARAKNQPEKAKEDLHADITDLLLESQGTLENVGKILNGILRIFQKYHVNVRPGITALLRTMVILDGTARHQSPDFNLQAMLEPYQAEAVKRRMQPGYMLRRFGHAFVKWDRFIEHLPGELSETLHKMRSGELRVELKHRHLDAVVNRLVLGILTAAMFLGSSLLWSMKAPPLVSDVSVFGAVGYGISVLLGWQVYKAIKGSGKVAPQD